jgi:hypothetical protein
MDENAEQLAKELGIDIEDLIERLTKKAEDTHPDCYLTANEAQFLKDCLTVACGL